MRFTIKVKLALVFLVFFSTAIILGGLGIFSLMDINEKNGEIVKNWLPGVNISRMLDTQVSDYNVLVFQHVAVASDAEMYNVEKNIKDMEAKIEESFNSYNNLLEMAAKRTNMPVNAQEKTMIDTVKNDWNKAIQVKERVLSISRQNDRISAMAEQAANFTPLINKVNAEIARIVKYNEENSTIVADEITAAYEQTRNTLLGVVVVAIIIGTIIIYWIGREIITSIGKLLVTSLAIAEGNLRVSSDIRTNDEIGELSIATNKMVESMRSLISDIQRSSEQVAASSEELTANADQSTEVTQDIAQSINTVSSMTVEQVSAVNAATSNMENVAAGIEESAAALQLVAEKTRTAVTTAKNGTETIDGAVQQMSNIEQTVNHLATVVTKLGERSKEIGQIVDTISGIAGQTNLLALNAAIEAARAGEQGRGFAVVAEEVRKLAEQSQEAAKEIANLISEIQTDTDQAVVAMDKGTEEVKTGASVVKNAGSAFAQIYEMVDVVNQQSNEMAKTMESLADGTQNVVNLILTIDESSKSVAQSAESVSAATEEQSASMQEIASSSRSLAELAQDLTRMSNKFEI